MTRTVKCVLLIFFLTVSYFRKGNGIVTHYLKTSFSCVVFNARFISGCRDDPVGERSTGIFQSYGTLRNILVISRHATAFFLISIPILKHFQYSKFLFFIDFDMSKDFFRRYIFISLWKIIITYISLGFSHTNISVHRFSEYS